MTNIICNMEAKQVDLGIGDACYTFCISIPRLEQEGMDTIVLSERDTALLIKESDGTYVIAGQIRLDDLVFNAGEMAQAKERNDIHKIKCMEEILEAILKGYVTVMITYPVPYRHAEEGFVSSLQTPYARKSEENLVNAGLRERKRIEELVKAISKEQSPNIKWEDNQQRYYFKAGNERMWERVWGEIGKFAKPLY